MAYRLRYNFNVDWVGPGAGPMSGMAAQQLPGGGGTGQTKEFINASNPMSNTFTGTDVTALVATATTDMTAQLNAALAQLQGWASGTP